MDLDKSISKLAYARQVEAEYRQSLAELEAEIKAHYGDALERAKHLLDVAREDVTDAEAAVRTAALERYSSVAQKQVHPAVMVKLFTILIYDDHEALDYCREHLPQALRLDKKIFEKAAAAVPPDFVTIHQEPRATITSDLSAYLEAVS